MVAAIGAALFLPRKVGAHATEFILAKMTPQPGGVGLELTIDCSGNPMIGSEAEARAVLGKVLRVRAGGQVRSLGELAPLRFERRTQVDLAAPIPHDPIEDAKPHQIVAALWSWTSSADKLSFEVPQDAGQSVILWTPGASPGQEPRWVMLIGGDVSPESAVPRRNVWSLVGLVLTGSALLVLAWLWHRRKPFADHSPIFSQPGV